MITSQKRDVIVIGGGLSGLAAGHRLAERGYDVLVLERDQQVGGRARTFWADEVPVELGAQFISDFYRETLQLVAALDLTEALVTRQQTAGIVSHGQVEPIWPAPALIKGPALSAVSKVRLLALAARLIVKWPNLDISHLNKALDLDGQSARSMAVGLIGNEANEQFFEPLLRGLLYWDAETTSEAVVLSILKAFIKSKKTYHLRDGLHELATTLAARIEVQVGTAANAITRQDDVFAVHTQAGEIGYARAVVVASTASEAGHLVSGLDPASAQLLTSITYSRTTILVYDVSTNTEDVPSSVALFPPNITELSSVNPIYDPRSLPSLDGGKLEMPSIATNPQQAQMLKVCLSSIGHDQTATMSDAELSAHVLEQVTNLMPAAWAKSARLLKVQRWPQALPEFRPGYLSALSKMPPTFTAVPGLACIGDYIGGPYIDGAIRSGLECAACIDTFLSSS